MLRCRLWVISGSVILTSDWLGLVGSGRFILFCCYQLSHYSSVYRVSHEEQSVEEVLRLGMARDRFLVSGACFCCRLG